MEKEIEGELEDYLCEIIGIYGHKKVQEYVLQDLIGKFECLQRHIG